MKYSTNTMMYSLIPLSMSMWMLYNNMFISLEISMTNFNSLFIPIGIILDWTSCLFLTTVMIISSMIFMFSMYYIPNMEYKQFKMLMMMFILSMSILIISDNIIFILLGWDGLGLSSYILVVYYQNYSSAASGTITLISNRVGDIMILLSISILMMNCSWNFNMNKEFNMITLMFLLIAAMSKSAQFPFSAWLPAAMAAPTPISALVHSSTLVTAGIFIMIRVMNNIHPNTMFIMMIVSSMTALYAGMAANWEQDMKKIIALSTLSQIAMMMFAISIKSTILAFFHLITHALFKSLMFLCAGIMIHNSSYQDMRMMGMNFYNSPLTSSILGISSMALMALPFMSGFFSKDAIIEMMMNMNFSMFLSMMIIISIGLTASYTIRMSLLSNNFLMKSKPDSNIHYMNYSNKPISMMSPMSILLGASLLWMIMPQNLFILPNNLKLLISSSLIMGILLGFLLSFKNKLFTTLGESSISLWFLHFITVNMVNKTSPISFIMLKNDNSWQELYGPQGLKSVFKISSYIPDMMKMSLIFTLILMFLIPLMFY